MHSCQTMLILCLKAFTNTSAMYGLEYLQTHFPDGGGEHLNAKDYRLM